MKSILGKRSRALEKTRADEKAEIINFLHTNEIGEDKVIAYTYRPENPDLIKKIMQYQN